jgi:spoIIIJ-associated protein
MKIEEEVKTVLEELMSLLEISATIDVSPVEEVAGEDAVSVSISVPDEAGLLIGAHGATLNAIQSFVAMAIRQKTDKWIRVNLDIGEWRKKHEEYLIDLAKQAAERARTTKENQHLYNLTPSQRRVIHMALSTEKGITTESEGEGENRYLVVKPQ